jgi:hypothetical protein
MTPPLQTLRGYLVRKRHTALLVTIVTAFLVRPLLGESNATSIVSSIAMMGLLLIALYTTQVDELVGERDRLLVQRRRLSRLGWALAIPAIGDRIYATFVPTHRMAVLAAVSWLVFLAVVTWIQLRTLLKHKEVTGETIAMSVSVYLLFAITWGMVYILIFTLNPDAFSLGPRYSSTPSLESNQRHVIPILLYFSLTTLSTIGFGDIVPVSLQARYLAVAEGIAGQFYLAILVARLVGMQMSQAARPDHDH